MNPYQDYKILISKRALKEIKDLPEDIKQHHLKKIFQLNGDTADLNIKKLHSLDDTYRLRVGDHRIVFKVFQEQHVIKIITDLHRKDVYKLFAHLVTSLDFNNDLDLDNQNILKH